MRHLPLTLLTIATAALLGFTFWAAQGPPDRQWTSAPGWSAARRVALSAASTAAPQAAPLAVDGAGQVYLLTIAGGAPMISAYGRDAGLRWSRGLESVAGEVRQPALLWDGGALRALWLARGQLYGAEVSPAGDLTMPAQPLANGAPAESFAAAADGRGSAFVWLSGPPAAPGVFALPPGDMLGSPQPIDPDGARPALQVVADGRLVAAWTSEGPAGALEIRRAIYPDGDLAAGSVAAVGSIDLGAGGLALSGPWLGADADYGYLLWSLQVTEGLNAGSSYSQYLSFPLDGGPAAAIRTIAVPAGADLRYAGGAGAPLGPRADLGASGSAPSDCAGAAGPGELAMLCKARVAYRGHGEVGQVGAILFAGGQPAGYQLLSFGAGAAYAPALARDGAGQAYASWLSLGDGGFDVYLASTAPDLGAALSRMGPRDIGRVGFESIYGMVAGLIFTPLTALLWAIVPLALIGITGPLRRGHGEPGHWATPLSLGLALAAYWYGKWLLLADARSYVPFMAWAPDMPAWLGLPLRVGVPLATLGLGLWAAWRISYRRERQSALLFLISYILVDAPLTMAIYGGVFFGALYPFA